MATDSWTNAVDLETPAGEALKKLAAVLPTERHFDITVFGSAPIQITVEPFLLSADVDLFCDQEDLEEYVVQAGLDKQHSDFYIQVCSGLNFRTSPLWGTRTQSFSIGNCTFILPHPIDILIAKLNRLDEKDLEAFHVVRRKTGHPTETELISELQMAVDLFRPGFDEENAADLGNNTRRLWPLLYGREIDVRLEIIAPALAKRRAGYDQPTRDYKSELREAVRAFQG
jgi:hypothetical protein